MDIRIKTLNTLTKEEYRACHYLNMRHEGVMMYSLMDNKNSDRAYSVMAWEGDLLLGWALLIPHGDDWSWHSSSHQRKKSKYVAQFYVRKPYRCKGVGRALMDAVNRLDKTPTVIPHDPTSADFFASYAVVTDRGRRPMITKAKSNKRKRLTAA